MTLQTREPTCRAGWPKILVGGGDKSGKSWSLALLSASPKVGRTVVLALGEDETRWDEYGLIPGARFKIAVHDGTWPSIMAAVEGAKEEAAKAREAGELPFVFGFDTMTAEWEGNKDWATFRARSSKKNKALLAQDPNAEIDVSSNYWNDAKRRHRALMRNLLTFQGIVVLIARENEVTLFQNGQPVTGRTTFSVESEKNLPFDVSAHVRLSREHRPVLVSASGVHCQIRPGIDPPRRLPDDWSLESLIFDTFKLDAATAHVGDFVEMKAEGPTPEEIRDELCNPQTDVERVRELYVLIQELQYAGVELANEHGDDEPLLGMAKRIGIERSGGGQNGPGLATRQPNGHQGNGNGQRANGQDGNGRRRPAGQAQEPASGEGWIRGFRAQLRTETDPGKVYAMRREITRAGSNGTITNEVVGILTAEVTTRKNELEQPASVPDAGQQETVTSQVAEAEFVQDFTTRLAEASLDDLGVMQREIGPAIRDRTISSETAIELTAAGAARRNSLEEAAGEGLAMASAGGGGS